MLSIILGIIVGIVIGLIPGLHPNLVAVIIKNLNIPNKESVLINGTIIYYFLSYIPLILFKIPSNSNGIFLVTKNLKNKIKIIAFTSLISFLISILLMDYFDYFYEIVGPIIKNNVLPLIIIFSFALILKDKPLISLFIFISSGILGLLAIPLKEPFLPMFSGFFSIYLFKKEEKIEEIKNGKINFLLILFGILLGVFSNLLPGISSPGQLIGFFSFLISLTNEEYIILLSSIMPSQFISSFSSYNILNVARNGVVKVTGGNFNTYEMVFMSFIGFLLLNILNKFSHLIKIEKIRFFVLTYILFIIFLFDGIYGIFIFVLAFLISLIAEKRKIKKTNLMGSLVLPTIMFLIS